MRYRLPTAISARRRLQRHLLRHRARELTAARAAGIIGRRIASATRVIRDFVAPLQRAKLAKTRAKADRPDSPLAKTVQSSLLDVSITDLVRVQMDEADTYTIAEFCVRNRICRAYYYKLRPLGLAPAEMRLGSKVLISKEAAAVWRRKMETANSKPPAAAGRLTARKVGRRTIITAEDAKAWQEGLPKVQPRVRVASIESAGCTSASPAEETPVRLCPTPGRPKRTCEAAVP